MTRYWMPYVGGEAFKAFLSLLKMEWKSLPWDGLQLILGVQNIKLLFKPWSLQVRGLFTNFWKSERKNLLQKAFLTRIGKNNFPFCQKVSELLPLRQALLFKTFSIVSQIAFQLQ